MNDYGMSENRKKSAIMIRVGMNICPYRGV